MMCGLELEELFSESADVDVEGPFGGRAGGKGLREECVVVCYVGEGWRSIFLMSWSACEGFERLLLVY